VRWKGQRGIPVRGDRTHSITFFLSIFPLFSPPQSFFDVVVLRKAPFTFGPPPPPPPRRIPVTYTGDDYIVVNKFSQRYRNFQFVIDFFFVRAGLRWVAFIVCVK